MTDKQNSASFEFYTDYIDREKALQPEYYAEVERIVNEKIAEFTCQNNRKPVVLDIGSAGIMPYVPENIECAVIVDLFRNNNVVLPDNVDWVIGNILNKSVVKKLSETKFDLVIVSSVLHHLCDSCNNEIKHLRTFSENLKVFTDAGAKAYIFESVCPQCLATLQDMIWPLQTFILNKLIGFTDVRMLSYNELLTALNTQGYKLTELEFKEPKYVAQAFIKVPLALYPLKIVALEVAN